MPGTMSGAGVKNMAGHVPWAQGTTVQLAGEKRKLNQSFNPVW